MSSQGQQTLFKYLNAYLKQLTLAGRTPDAVGVLAKYGAEYSRDLFPVYESLAREVFAKRMVKSYRDVKDLCRHLKVSPSPGE